MERSPLDRFAAPLRLPSKQVSVGVFVVGLLSQIGLFVYKGEIIRFPDTEDYVGACSTLWSEPLNLVGAHVGMDYIGFIIPFCSTQALTGGSFSGWVAVQMVLYATTMVLVYLTGRRLWGSEAGVLGALMLPPLYELGRYSVAILSEGLFTFTIALTLYAAIHHRQEQTKRSQALFWLAGGWMAVTRPFGLPILGLLIALELLPARFGLDFRLVESRTTVLGVFALAVGVLLSSSRGSWTRSYLVSTWERGDVFWRSAHDFLPTPGLGYQAEPASSLFMYVVLNADHLFLLTVTKGLYFLLPLPTYALSSTSFLVSAVTYTALLIGAAYTVLTRIRTEPERILIVLCPFLATWGVVSLTFLTPTYRYRAPALVSLAVLAGSAYWLLLERLHTYVHDSPRPEHE